MRLESLIIPSISRGPERRRCHRAGPPLQIAQKTILRPAISPGPTTLWPSHKRVPARGQASQGKRGHNCIGGQTEHTADGMLLAPVHGLSPPIMSITTDHDACVWPVQSEVPHQPTQMGTYFRAVSGMCALCAAASVSSLPASASPSFGGFCAHWRLPYGWAH
jgi:hypothetical protein